MILTWSRYLLSLVVRGNFKEVFLKLLDSIINMKKPGGIIAIIVGIIFCIVTLNVFFRGLLLLSENDKDMTGSVLLVSYLIPGGIVASISFLLIRHGIKSLKSRDSKSNLPSNASSTEQKNNI